MNISVGDEKGRLIPYQDHSVTGPTYDKYYLSTCHGPVGSTLAFREVYEVTGEELYKNWTIELSRGIVKAGRRKGIPGASGTASASAAVLPESWSILPKCTNIPVKKNFMIIWSEPQTYFCLIPITEPQAAEPGTTAGGEPSPPE